MSDDTPPSSLRLTVSLFLALVAFPLGVLAWIALSGSHRVDYLRSRWIRLGGACVLVSALPLISLVAAAALGLTSDPNPNPIGLGLLFLAGSVLGTLLAGVGTAMVALREPLLRRP